LGYPVLGALEVILTRIVKVGKIVIAGEEELERACGPRRLFLRIDGPTGEHAIHGLGRRGDSEVDDGLAPEVVHAVVGVLRGRPQAAFAPFERALGAILLPDLGGAGALEDQGELLVEVVLDVQRLTRWDLADKEAALSLIRAGELEKRRQPLAGA